MIKEDNRISKKERGLLKELVGRRITRIEAAIVSPPNVAWNTIRIHSENTSIDVNCYLTQVAINDDGDSDEFGVISICKAPKSKLSIDTISSETEVFEIDKMVKCITVLENKVIALENKRPFCEREFTKSIVIDFEDETLLIDKLAWFDEMLKFSLGSDVQRFIYDESHDWESDEDDDITFEYTLKKVEL